jgi:hypothetical protein
MQIQKNRTCYRNRLVAGKELMQWLNGGEIYSLTRARRLFKMSTAR